MKHLFLIVLAPMLLSAYPGCNTTSGDDDAGIDAGTGDADGDTDTDADGDTDTDTDSDTDEQGIFPPGDCTVETVNGIEIEWCAIPAATCNMGCRVDIEGETMCEDYYYPGYSATPDHIVFLDPYEMMATEVSVAMYVACVEDGGCDWARFLPFDDSDDAFHWVQRRCNWGRYPVYDYPSGFEDHPMNCVDWEGLRQFCQWIGSDLPTEAQWEHAARGVYDGYVEEYWMYPYAIDDNAAYDTGCTYALSDAHSWYEPCEYELPAPVGSLFHTSFGLHDMAGNIGEWVYDWYSTDFYASGENSDPDGPDAGTDKVARGGAYRNWLSSGFIDDLQVLRSSRRAWFPPDKETLLTEGFSDNFVDNALAYLGGRCARPGSEKGR